MDIVLVASPADPEGPVIVFLFNKIVDILLSFVN